MRKLIILLLAMGVSYGDPLQLEIGLNFRGSTFEIDSNFIPPDSNGAVGKDYFVELVNGRYSVYDKINGTRIQTSSLDQFWSNSGVDPYLYSFDPRVVYDHESERWFAASVDAKTNANHFLVAVSKTADPTEGWKGFSIDSDGDGSHWADFPTLGLDRETIYISANMVNQEKSIIDDVSILKIPKGDLTKDSPTVDNAILWEHVASTQDHPGYSLQPAVDFLGKDPEEKAILLSSYNNDLRAITEISGLDLSTKLVEGPFAPSPPDAAQPDGTKDLETNDLRFSSAAFEVGNSVWAVQCTEIDGKAGIRWYEFGEIEEDILNTGIISDPDLDLFYPSIAANEFGEVVIGYNGSGSGQFISSYAALGQSGDTGVTFGEGVLLAQGQDVYHRYDSKERNRWGDYSFTSLDPEDHQKFWTIQEICLEEGIWTTQITELRVRPIPEAKVLILFGCGLAFLELRRRIKKGCKRRSP